MLLLLQLLQALSLLRPFMQMLVGGENVYCSEVEAVLHQNAFVAAASAFGIPNALLGEVVAVAVVLAAGAVPTDGTSAGVCLLAVRLYLLAARVRMNTQAVQVEIRKHKMFCTSVKHLLMLSYVYSKC